MIAWLAFYAGLTAATWTALRPMLRMPSLLHPTQPVADTVPVATFDFGGLI